MKTVTLLLLLYAFSLNGQNITNGDFESWVTIPNTFGGMDPVSWKSTNAATAGGNVKAITRSTDKYNGLYALSIQPLIAGSVTDTLTSCIVIGTAPLNFSTYKLEFEKGGLPSPAARISSVHGYYKLKKGFSTFDSAFAIVLCKSANDNSYTASGYHEFDTSSVYQRFTIQLNEHQNAASDSLVIAFFFRSNETSPFTNSRLLVDSLGYDLNTTALDKSKNEEHLQMQVHGDKLIVSPSLPGLYQYEVYSMTGELLQSQTLNLSGSTEKELPATATSGVIRITDPAGRWYVKRYLKHD